MKNHMIGPFGLALLAALTVGMVGCSGDATRSPAAPTAATVSSAVSGSSVSASHHGGGDNSGPGNSGGSGDNSGPGNAGNDSNKQVELRGTIQAVSGACPALRLTIAGRNVSTTASTEFKDAACARVAAGQTAEVKGTLQADGSIAATRIEADANENENEAEVTGAITASTGACPTLTLTVGTTKVTTTAVTIFHDGACSVLTVGTVIEAKGTRQNDGSLVASTVEREGVE
jgi:uncharacterized protein DUF5666